MTFNVLGTTSTGAEGAALLAHASGCPTAFYRIELQKDRLVPIVEPGPIRERGEKFADFGRRFHHAYERKLSELVTGDPLNLTIRPRWLRVFAAAEEDGCRHSG